MKYTMNLFLTRQQITDALTAAGFERRDLEMSVDGYWRLAGANDLHCDCGLGEPLDVARFVKREQATDGIDQMGFITIWRHLGGVTIEGAWDIPRDSQAAYLAAQTLNRLDTRTDDDAR